jgi:hypothetical protein
VTHINLVAICCVHGRQQNCELAIDLCSFYVVLFNVNVHIVRLNISAMCKLGNSLVCGAGMRLESI